MDDSIHYLNIEILISDIMGIKVGVTKQPINIQIQGGG